MTAQEWIVGIIVALAAAAALRRLVCRLRGADKCASCGAEECPLHRLRRKGANPKDAAGGSGLTPKGR